jgi:Flp pilus assembly protein TadB
MELPSLQTWIIFYLISFVVLLWAAFLSAQGIMLWVSFFLVIVVIGVNFWVVYGEVKKHAERKKLQQFFTSGVQSNEPKPMERTLK